MRMIVIKQDTDLEALKGNLLKARTATGQADSALAALQKLNPHADLTKLSPGQVLLVPDLSAFKVTASDPVLGGALDQFRQVISDSLDRTAASLKTAQAADDAVRADVTAAFNTAGVQRLMGSDAALKQQVADVTKTFQQDQDQAKQAASDFAAASTAALAKLTQLSKLMG
jgi:phytoene/squalene synthetase